MKRENPKLLTNARSLRHTMTPWENKLWYQFLRLYPVKFRRQFPVGTYILDFYCHSASLCVELDGGGHDLPEQREYDRKRTAFLEEQGICVLRFSNLDVDRNFTAVCTVIDEAVKKRLKKRGD